MGQYIRSSAVVETDAVLSEFYELGPERVAGSCTDSVDQMRCPTPDRSHR